MDIELIAKPLAFVLFTVSGSRFERRVAVGAPREAAFGSCRHVRRGEPEAWSIPCSA